MASERGFGYSNLVVRWLLALFLVMATYNPSGTSYWHWLTDVGDQRWSLKLLVGTTLLVLDLTFVLATFRALRLLGVLTAAAFFGAIVWTLHDFGALQALSTGTWVTIWLAVVGSILGIGVSWSYMRARVSGQVDSNDITL